MSSANISSSQALGDLDAALGRFSGEAQDAMQAADVEIKRTLDWLHDRLNYRLREVERRQEAYDACRKRKSRRDSDCREEEAALRLAQEELAGVRRWLSHVEQAVTSYNVHAQRLRDLTADRTTKARAMLVQAQADVELYHTISSSAGELAGPG